MCRCAGVPGVTNRDSEPPGAPTGSLARQAAQPVSCCGWTPTAFLGPVRELRGLEGDVHFEPPDRLGLPLRRRCATQGRWTRSLSRPRTRSASVRPARLLVETPSPT